MSDEENHQKPSSSIRKYVILTATLAFIIAYIYSSYGPSLFQETHSAINFQKPEQSDNYIQTPTGLWLYVHKWVPSNPETEIRSIVFIIHGFAEHAGRLGYSSFARHLTEEGSIVYAIDHQGHGKSTGDRGHVQHFEDYVEDLLFFMTKVTNEYKPIPPIFLFAHSMGTIVASHAMINLKYPENSTIGNIHHYTHILPYIRGTILSGIGMEVDKQVLTPTVETMINLFSFLVPKLAIDSLPSNAICRNEEAVQRYMHDPLIFKSFLARWSKEYLNACFKMKEFTHLIDWPLLIIHGTNDSIANIEGAYYVFNNSSTSLHLKTKLILDGALHETLEDNLAIADVYRSVDGFINSLV